MTDDEEEVLRAYVAAEAWLTDYIPGADMSVCDDNTTVCTKGQQARVYCRREPCINREAAISAWIAAVNLPQPTVDVKTGTMTTEGGTEVQHVEVTLGRDGKERSYTGVASSTPGAVKEVVEKILDDHRNAEFVRHR